MSTNNNLQSMLDAVRFQLELSRSSQNTIRMYSWHIKRFFKLTGISVEKLTVSDVRLYLHSQVKNNYCADYINQSRAALRLLFKVGFHQSLDETDLPRVRKTVSKPVVLSQDEIRHIFSLVKNPRYKVILLLCYSSGLRLGEALCLHIRDIDSTNIQIFIRQGKNLRDRYTILSPYCLEQLRRYWKMYRPKGPLLFPGASEVKPMARQGWYRPRKVQKKWPCNVREFGRVMS